MNDRQVAMTLGFPMRRREDAPKTYATPTIKRKIVPTPPSAKTSAFELEPALDMENYETILSIMSNMAIVLERSPQAFKNMGEEDFRQHFLVQLNGQYEGQASGETFNMGGKTDILIREKGKNIFIAECKFWNGPVKFIETINQLLGYMSWRDTKAALVIFNRGTKLSTVLEKIPSLIETHPSCKRKLDYRSETGFRYMLHHNDDTNREIMTTVLVFEVPE